MTIQDTKAPSYPQLRPYKPLTTATFPVYHQLVRRLVSPATEDAEAIAHTMAVCAGYAYSDGDTVAMMMARMGLRDNSCRAVAEHVDAMFISSTAFLVQSADGRVVILAYRGTEPTNFVTWLTDADVYSEPVWVPLRGHEGSFGIHGGFYRNVRATRHVIIGALRRAVRGQSVLGSGRKLPHPLEALYITGHSLGGAMAALMGVMLVSEPDYEPIASKLRAVYTFGQPMVGDPAFARACDEDPFLGRGTHRFVYRHDVVPHLPPTTTGEFAHFGREFTYGEEWPWVSGESRAGQLGNLFGLVEAPVAFLARQVRGLRGFPFKYSLYDHGPHLYISALTPPGVVSEFGDP